MNSEFDINTNRQSCRLERQYLKQRAQALAPQLLGKLLCRCIDGQIKKARIIETECYVGEDDTACHASKGKTNRTSVMYGEGGYAYVYLCYGIHHLFNVVAGVEGFPEAVLVRGVENAVGPGRATTFLSITREQYGIDLTQSDELWLEDDGCITEYKTAKRVGIDYASEIDRNRPWRFIATKFNFK